MSYVKTSWKDRVVERPNTYTMTDNGNGTVTLTPVPGQIIERGTPLNAENLNKIEDAIVETNAQLSHTVLNPKMFGAKGDGLTDDLESFNDMVAYGKTNVIKHIKLYPGTYHLSDTFYLPSGWTIEGVGKVVIIQDEKDSPVIATEEWRTCDTPCGQTRVLGINIGGGTGMNNHGLLIYDYYATIDRVFVNNVGGRGVFLTSKNYEGGTTTGTLVENTITNCQVRKTGDVCYYLGEINNNKLTDGIIQNCMGSAGEGAENVLYIGSSAGWFIDNIHTYGSPNVAIAPRNAYYTTISNIYIESFKANAISLHIQNSLTMNNVSIRLNKDTQNGVDVIYVNKSSIDVGMANFIINNLTMVTGTFAENTKINGINVLSNKIRCAISNYNVVGSSPDSVEKITGQKENVNYFESFMVEKELSESKYNLMHDDKKLKYCDAQKFSGNNPVSIKFKLNELSSYGKIMCDIAICGCSYDNGSMLVSYSSKLMISAKDNNANEWKVYVFNESTKTGFSVEPTFTVDKLSNELTISFTPQSNQNTGIISLGFISV
ncbi:MAG: hypothetical protein Q3980_14825 [Turicibacter sp.]|nr:hypothetical protein [Turicibacter sp.]